MTATQLNADYVDSETPDQNLLSMLETTQKDRDALADVVAKSGFEMPDIKISVYKNRRGRWKSIYLWCHSDRGTCRIKPIFVT